MAELHVSRQDLSDALAQLARVVRKKPELTLRLAFSGETLSLELPGCEVAIPASGAWAGTAHVPWTPLARICHRLPAGEVVRMAFEDGRLRIAAFGLSARWEDISPPAIPVPLNLTPAKALQLATRCTEAELATSGLTGVVEKAHDRLERRIFAAYLEIEEFGVSLAELQELVVRCLRRSAEVESADRPPYP